MSFIKITQKKTQVETGVANYVMAQEIPLNLVLSEIREELKKKKFVLYEWNQELELVVDVELIHYNFEDIVWGELNIKLGNKVRPINVVGLYDLLNNPFINKPLGIIIVSPEVEVNSRIKKVQDPRKKEILEKLSKIGSFTGSREKARSKSRSVDTSSFIKTKKERNTIIRCVKCGKEFKVPSGTVIKEYTCYGCSTKEGYMPEPSLPGKVPFARFNINNVIHFKSRSYRRKKETSLKEDISLLKYTLEKKKKNN